MKRYNKAVLAARTGEFEEFMNTLNGMDFEDACAYCYDNWSDINTYDDMKEIAKICIDNNQINEAQYIINAMYKNEAPYYSWDSHKGTMMAIKPIRNEDELELYVASKFK